ncbi:MAG: ComEC/Rec2 family competence protein [Dehalococcoidales bacterium]|nr:ComEC/Rec2 family competence protein [Dehalococcoidales bacterium]
MKKIIIPLFLLLAALIIALYAVNYEKDPPPVTGVISVHFIDVGQGDAILIDYGTTEILIDGGEKSSQVADYLDRYVDGNMEIMIATHAHADHIGGLISVLERFTVEQIWYDGYAYSSKTFTDFISASEAENAAMHIARRGDVISAGGLTLLVLHPDITSSDLNNNSIVLGFSYGIVDFLFTGDAEHKSETSMLLSPAISVPDIEILKVGHHGSRTASSTEFLSVLTPEIAIYMAETGNSYGHPHQETLDALLDIGAHIYGTDSCGTIIITTDGETYQIKTEKLCDSVTAAP